MELDPWVEIPCTRTCTCWRSNPISRPRYDPVLTGAILCPAPCQSKIWVKSDCVCGRYNYQKKKLVCPSQTRVTVHRSFCYSGLVVVLWHRITYLIDRGSSISCSRLVRVQVYNVLNYRSRLDSRKHRSVYQVNLRAF